jgi:glycosyltransferase involved in cell wall biosynthesis
MASLPANPLVHIAEPIQNTDFTSITATTCSIDREDILLNFSDDEQAFVLSRVRRLIDEGKLTVRDLIALPSLPSSTDATAIIPARNEAATIAEIVRAVRPHVAEIIVVEGGSTDETAERACAAGARVIRDPGLGKGSSMRLAVAEVRTPFCIFVDADGSHDPIDIPRLLAPLRNGEAEHVGGSRMLGGSDELHGGGDEFLRLAGSSLITYLVNLRYGTRISDSQNGFRAIRTDFFRSLDLRSRHTTIEMEMVMATLAAGGRIREVPTRERRRAAGYSKISLSRPGVWLAYGWTLLRGLCRRSHGPLQSMVSSG